MSTLHNSVYGDYVTSATFCMKLGKGEILALSQLDQVEKIQEGTNACFWSLGAKGLIESDSNRVASLTEAGKLAVKLLKIANLIRL
jgi:hypothetical protein